MSSPSAQCASGGSDLFLRPSLSRDSDYCVAAYEMLSELLGERVVIQQALFLRGRDYDTAVRLTLHCHPLHGDDYIGNIITVATLNNNSPVTLAPLNNNHIRATRLTRTFH